ncbi:DUF2017 family protein [Microbacterium sp. TNHR37B]|uniref:DUF2017 family protein n=1 Tax=Microbacterium sp. TNHR37B TaxID=1775956 RepID=UPI0007B21AF5|nr:DUF2017 family protein [Microbacterium sp. TNHR37B]KZE91039.1 hypothetical protein AVP41_00572 [Microbacterium sp. TNHR37B]
MTGQTLLIDLAALEIAHLRDLLDQFAALLEAQTEPVTPDDPAIARLVPDAYAEDRHAAREFRSLTQSDLLARRIDDARLMSASLAAAVGGDASGAAPDSAVLVTLDADAAAAWLRTLAALRLVLASRLGITEEADGDVEDPLYGVYEWLGFRLDSLLSALEA